MSNLIMLFFLLHSNTTCFQIEQAFVPKPPALPNKHTSLAFVLFETLVSVGGGQWYCFCWLPNGPFAEFSKRHNPQTAHHVQTVRKFPSLGFAPFSNIG